MLASIFDALCRPQVSGTPTPPSEESCGKSEFSDLHDKHWFSAGLLRNFLRVIERAV
jgi:hypothetical protein